MLLQVNIFLLILDLINKIIIMKKLLLFGAVLMGSYFTASAQNTCLGATVIPVAGGTFTTPAINGTFPSGGNVCTFADGNHATPKAVWYSYTPTSTGLLTVDAGIAANAITVDTRLRILSGTCGTFTCVAQNDDINYDGTANSDLRSRISNLVVNAGTTYYIIFDNRWIGSTNNPGGAGNFPFQVTFTATSCFAPTAPTIPAGGLTTNSLTVNWTAPATGTVAGYQVEYGPVGFVQGTGVTLSPTTASATLSPLNPGTDYAFYIRTFCGGTSYSAWAGPYTFTTQFAPASVPYSYGFETNNLDGWSYLDGATGAAWDQYQGDATAPAQSGTLFAGIVGSTTAASDSWIFSRALNLSAGTNYTLKYFLSKVNLQAGTTSVNNLAVSVGTATSVAGQTISLATLNNYSSTTYAEQTHTFTVPTTGVYFIGFRYTSAIQTTGNVGGLTLDTVSINATAGTNDFLASKLSIYPVPANDVINIANAENILINGAEIVDLNGRTVKAAKFNGVSEASINISDLASGMYMMTVSSDQGTLTKKIVKQ